MRLLLHWIVYAIAIAVTAYVLPGVRLSGFSSALITALVLGLINSVIRPILLFFTLPLNILTLGLLTFVINAFLILVTSYLVPGFGVAGFWWALIFSLVLSVIHYLLNLIVW